MLKFTEIDQETPNKRGTEKRKGDFNEIYDEFIVEKAKSNQADVLNAVFLSVKYIVHFTTIFQTG